MITSQFYKIVKIEPSCSGSSGKELIPMTYLENTEFACLYARARLVVYL